MLHLGDEKHVGREGVKEVREEKEKEQMEGKLRDSWWVGKGGLSSGFMKKRKHGIKA